MWTTKKNKDVIFCPGTTKSTRLYNINFSGAKFLYTKLKRAI